MKRWQRITLWTVGTLFGLLAATFFVLWLALRHPMPVGELAGADDLAHAVEANVNVDAWRKTGAVSWGFRQHRHLWDKTRNLARVDFGDGTVVLLDVAHQRGNADQKTVDRAYRAFINDSFWLNPLAKLFDSGVERRRVGNDLLVTYTSGGVTPGDQYLWLLDGNRPRAWRIWVKVVPIGGAEFSWEGWTTLATGAVVATLHKVSGHVALELTDVKAATTLAELIPGADPFAALSPTP